MTLDMLLISNKSQSDFSMKSFHIGHIFKLKLTLDVCTVLYIPNLMQSSHYFYSSRLCQICLGVAISELGRILRVVIFVLNVLFESVT